MPDIDRTADIKVTAAQATVTAEIPLAGHASKHWLEFFSDLVSQQRQHLNVEAEEREDRTWIIVWLPSARPDFHPEPMLDTTLALISNANGMERQFQSGGAQIEAAVRGWWARQQQ
jgi:hypothetical protein